MQVSYEGELVLRSAQLFIKLAMLDLDLNLMGAMVFAKKNWSLARQNYACSAG